MAHYTLSIKDLYDKFGNNLTHGYITTEEAENGDFYYDFYNREGRLGCCDGETVKILSDDGAYVLQSDNAPEGVTFTLSEEEFNVAVVYKDTFLRVPDLMFDFWRKSKGDFLKTHSNVSEQAYDGTVLCLDDAYEPMKTGFTVLCTFPEDDKNYCHQFSVETVWLANALDKMDYCNEQKGVDLENFLQNYCWVETYAIYKMAKAENRIIAEMEEV